MCCGSQMTEHFISQQLPQLFHHGALEHFVVLHPLALIGDRQHRHAAVRKPASVVGTWVYECCKVRDHRIAILRSCFLARRRERSSLAVTADTMVHRQGDAHPESECFWATTFKAAYSYLDLSRGLQPSTTGDRITAVESADKAEATSSPPNFSIEHRKTLD